MPDLKLIQDFHLSVTLGLLMPLHKSLPILYYKLKMKRNRIKKGQPQCQFHGRCQNGKLHSDSFVGREIGLNSYRILKKRQVECTYTIMDSTDKINGGTYLVLIA